MGLDSYLSVTKYLSGYGFRGEKEVAAYKKIIADAGMDKLVEEGSPTANIEVTVAYWRKANAIHRFFVENCSDGTDDCRKMWVERFHLEDLRDRCEQILNSIEGYRVGYVQNPDQVEWIHKVDWNSTVAENLLPTQSGFFFGDTDYNEWYVSSLEYTLERLNFVLSNVPKGAEWGFIYQASW